MKRENKQTADNSFDNQLFDNELETTVNFHLTTRCNFNCKFCFAHTCGASKIMSLKKQISLVKCIAKESCVRKINFVGGEPTINRKHLEKLLKKGKKHGVVTSITTNGSLIDAAWIANNAKYIDILALSVDSINANTNLKSGRCTKGGKALTIEHYLSLAKACHENNITLKINTVVSKFNVSETLTDFINEMQPFHWKIFQVMKVSGENSSTYNDYSITNEKFESYISRQRANLHPSVEIIPENNELMRGSYLMVNPEGCFFDSTSGAYKTSQPILEVGFKNAMNQIRYDHQKFIERGGDYALPKENMRIGLYDKTKHFIQRQTERLISDLQLFEILKNVSAHHNTKGVFIVGRKIMKKVGLNKRGENLIIAFDHNILVTLYLVANITEYLHNHPCEQKFIL